MRTTMMLRGLVGALAGLLVAGGAHAADIAQVAVAATVLSQNNCRFRSAGPPLNFGTVDPTSPVDVTASVSITFVCRGRDPVAWYDISEDFGLYETVPGGNRMRHASDPTAFLSYSLSLNPSSGMAQKNVNQTLTITGILRGSDYQLAVAGSYADTVVITIVP